MTIRSLSALLLCSATLATPALAHDGTHHNVTPEDVLKGCAAELGSLPWSVNVVDNEAPAEWFERFDVPPAPDNGDGNLTCSDFSWMRIKSRVPLKNVRPDPYTLRKPGTTDWDCNHSSITYGVYVRAIMKVGLIDSVVVPWTYLGGGQMWGRRVSGNENVTVCAHSVSTFPRGFGSDQFDLPMSFPPGLPLRYEYAAATSTWVHDDPNLAHRGNECGGLKTCYLKTSVGFNPN